MTTRVFTMPRTSEIGTAGQNGRVRLDEGWHKFLGGTEDVSKRVAAYVSGTPTTVQLRDALVAAGLMKAE